MTPNPPLPRVNELDGLRGVLAVWVVISHLFCWTGFASIALPAPFGKIWERFVFGQPAVEVFIILSGFAISFFLEAEKPTYAAFMRGRFFRIYPVYLVCLALGLAAICVTPFILAQAQWRGTEYFRLIADLEQNERQQLWAHVASHLTLLNGLIPNSILPGATGTLLAPAWSISLEWQFYLVAPLIALLVRSPWGLLLVCAGACGGTWVQAYWYNPHLAFLPAQLPLFLVGIGSYHWLAYCKRTSRPSVRQFVLITAVLLASAFLLSWHWVSVTIWTLIFGCVTLEGSGGFAKLSHFVRTFLLHRRLQQLGRISYPVYLVHWPIIIFCLALLIHFKPTISSAEAVGVMLLFATPLILIAAGLLHHFVEAPAMKLGKRRKQPIPPS